MNFTTTYSMTNPAIRVGVADSRIQSLSFTAGRSPDEPMPQLNWSELKQQMERLEQGYF